MTRLALVIALPALCVAAIYASASQTQDASSADEAAKPGRVIEAGTATKAPADSAAVARATDKSPADWPQWRGPARDGMAEQGKWDPARLKDPKILWEKDVGPGSSSMVVHRDRVYTVGNVNNEDVVYCLNAKTGEEIWTLTYPCPLDRRQFEGGPASTPTIDGDSIYVFSHRGELRSIDLETGKQRWLVDVRKTFGGNRPQWGYSTSPLVVDGKVIVDAGASDGKSLVALDQKTGKLVWGSGNSEASYASPVLMTINNQPHLAHMNAFGLVVVRISDGKEFSSFRWKTAYNVNAPTPVVFKDKVYICSGYGSGGAVVQVQEGRAKEIWRNDVLSPQMSTPVFRAGFLYGINDGSRRRAGQLRCVEFETGKVRWTSTGFGQGTLILVDGKLIILSERGELVIAEAKPDEYTELARAQILSNVCWVAPAMSNGRVFAKNNLGKLVAVDLTAR